MEWGWMWQQDERLREWPDLHEARRWVAKRVPRYWLDDRDQLWLLDFKRRKRSRRPTLLLSDFGFPPVRWHRLKDHGRWFGWKAVADQRWADELVAFTHSTRPLFNDGRNFPYAGSGVYELREPRNGFVYIGASMDIGSRMQQWLGGYARCNARMQVENVSPNGDWFFRVVERWPECDGALLSERERVHVAAARAAFGDLCLNVSDGGGAFGGIGKGDTPVWRGHSVSDVDPPPPPPPIPPSEREIVEHSGGARLLLKELQASHLTAWERAWRDAAPPHFTKVH